MADDDPTDSTLSLRDRLLAVFRATFEPAPACDIPGLKYRDLPAWNSVGHMQLVAALETAFDVMLETDDIIAMDSFTAAERIIERALAPPA